MRRIVAATGTPSPGATLSTDHAKCGDTRGRAYVTCRPPLLLVYCHNCADGGTLLMTGPSIAACKEEPKGSVDPRPAMPSDAVVWTKAPAEGRTWLTNSLETGGLGDPERIAHGAGVKWSEQYGRMVLPVYPPGTGLEYPRDISVPVGCQLRAVWQGQLPKYLTLKPTSAPLETLISGASPGYYPGDTYPRALVIVEDLISAWLVAWAGFDVIPMLGLNFRVERLPKLIDAYYKIVVWTDNDCDAAILERERIVDMGACLGGCMASVTAPFQDPKSYPTDFIRKKITEAV